MRKRAVVLAGLGVIVAMAAGCRGERSDRRNVPVVVGGDAQRGVATINEFGCGACHTIPGIRGATGLVGPPLTKMGLRTYIAGRLPNEPEALVRWVQTPQRVDDHTAMPNLGLTEQQARDVAAYLYTLR